MQTRLVEIDAMGRPAAEATVLVAQQLAEAISEGGTFQALVRMPHVAERAQGPQATRSVRMLREIRPGLVEHCAGLAFVADEATKAARGRGPEAERRLWGCPVTTVTSMDDAHAWLSSACNGQSPRNGDTLRSVPAEFDEWPLVRVVLPGNPQAADSERVMTILAAAARVGQAFGFLIVRPPGVGVEPTAEPGAAAPERGAGREMRALREQLSLYCCGIVYAVYDAEPREQVLALAPKAERLFASSVAVYETTDQAERWLRARLEERDCRA